MLFHQERARLADADRAAHFGRARVLHRQRVDAGLECLHQCPRRLDLRQVPQHVEIVEVDGLFEQLRFHELL